jgi:hypothetical protein
MPLVCPSWLLCCLLSSAASRPAAPPSVHISLLHHILPCPLFLWCACLLSAPAVCHVTSSDATASHPPVPPPLIAPLPLIVPLSCLLSSWLLCCLSLPQRLLSAGASNFCRAVASSCAPPMPLIYSGWLWCSQGCDPIWTHNF